MNTRTRKPIVIYDDISEEDAVSYLAGYNGKQNSWVALLIVLAVIIGLFFGIRVIVRLLKLMT